MSEYQALLDWLTANPQYAALHADITAQVAPYVTQMQAAMTAIITIMQAIEAATPGTFGIELPQEQAE